MNKVAIVVGHRSKAKGAYSLFLKLHEYDFNFSVADRLADIADIYERPNTPFVSEATRIKKLTAEINKQKYDLVIELHFNAAADSRAHGCTALHYVTNEKTKKICKRYIFEMTSVGLRNRNPIPISSKFERGGVFITNCKADAILLEPFFGSNKNDCDLILSCFDEHVEVIRDIILNYDLD